MRSNPDDPEKQCETKYGGCEQSCLQVYPPSCESHAHRRDGQRTLQRYLGQNADSFGWQIQNGVDEGDRNEVPCDQDGQVTGHFESPFPRISTVQPSVILLLFKYLAFSSFVGGY